MRQVLNAVTVVILIVLGGTAVAQQHTHVILAPNEITFGPLRPGGTRWAVIEGNPEQAGPFTMRVLLPANWTIAPHFHAATEYLTVLSGTLYAGVGERFSVSEMKALPAGGFMVMPPKTPHYLLVKEETTIQVQMIGPLVLTYIDQTGDPIKQ